jgi:hypothetical protein
MISLIFLSSSLVILMCVAPKFSSKYLHANSKQGQYMANSDLDGPIILDALSAWDWDNVITLIHQPS